MAKASDHYLNLLVTAEAVTIDAHLPSGFKVKVTGEMGGIVELVKALLPELKKVLNQAKGGA